MKKIFWVVSVFYLLMLCFVCYMYFAVGLITPYKALHWKEIDVDVPENFNIKDYQSKEWQVYSLKKSNVLIKIAFKSAFDVSGLPKYHEKISFQYSPDPESIYYISNQRKLHEIIYAKVMEDTALYFSVASPSAYTSKHILEKVLKNGRFREEAIDLPSPSLPTSVYTTDIIFVIGVVFPYPLIFFIFSLSGARPASKYFDADPIILDETAVQFTSARRYRRRNSFCYIAATPTRFMVFLFKKPIMEIPLGKSDIKFHFEKKKIIIQTEKEKYVLKPGDIEQWRTILNRYQR